jgi:hypothetical protein
MREKIIDALRAAGVVTVERSGGSWCFTDASGAFIVLWPEEIMQLLERKTDAGN